MRKLIIGTTAPADKQDIDEIIKLTYIRWFYDEKTLTALKPLLIFIFLNTIKLVVLDIFIINPMSLGLLLYKYIFTFVFEFVIFISVFKFRSRYLFVSFYIIQFTYVFANLAYYIYFHSYLHILLSPALIKESANAVSHFSIPTDPRLLSVFLDLPAFVYVCAKYRGITSFKSRLKLFRGIAVALCLLILVCAEMLGGFNGGFTSQLIKTYTTGGESKIVHRYGTLFNSIADVLLVNGDKNAVNRLEYSEKLISGSAKADNPNFVVIQVESLDSNVINQKYKGQYIAPFLHSLSEECVYFPYTLSYHRAGGTSDCEFSIINSVEPLDDYPAMKISGYNFPNSMLNKLKDSSYNTAAFHGNVGSFFSRDKAFPVMGFKNYFDLDRMKLKNQGWGAPDRDVFNYVRSIMKNEKAPFLNYIITMTMHAPFNNADYYYHEKNYQDLNDDLVARYFNSVSYTDKSINEFVTFIRENFKDTYIFIWGDHTPSIINDNYRQASYILDNKYFEYVPLLVITPDSKKYRENKMVISFLDIAPTILKASGVPFTIRSDGQDLLNGTDSSIKVPFKGHIYDRTILFEKMNN
ncbi:MAG: LTA synthase family protein [Bacillota bacterium]|nr:LTA synthase family protein [Bacillota bacterium]